MERFLITTADERTWPKDQPVLFLGEWCKLYHRHHVWSKMDMDVVPYHWDDRNKLYRDYCNLSALYERVLAEVANRLNEIHHVNHSLRYWRILIGPWLGYFIQMVFDRWEMIQSAVIHYKISGARFIDGDLSRLVPNDMADFHRLFVSDQWNQAIYGYMLEHWTDVHCQRVGCQLPESTNIDISNPQINIKRRIKRCITGMASKVLATSVRQDEAFFITDYLPLRQSFALQWRLGQIPRMWRMMIATPPVAANSESRRWRLSDSYSNIFEQVLHALIPLQIPTAYLEGYGDMKKQVTALPWPKSPRFIFTSNSYSMDEVFKAWAAAKVEAGVPFIIGQHGSYGVALWGSNEDHQLAISDVWISWGWEDVSNSKIKPVGNLKMIGRRLGWDRDGCALLVQSGMMPRYSYHMLSAPVSSQWIGYFDDQFRFVDAMPQSMREELLVRLSRQDYGWCVKQRWQDRFPKIRLDEGVTPIASLIKKSRLCISAYNATSLMESLAMNIPTIMFWNPNHWEVRASAQPYFDRLREVGIFHETPESAAAKVVEVWDDVYNWWHQSHIQEARLYFCNRFSIMPSNPLRILQDTLTSIKPLKPLTVKHEHG